MRLYCQLVNEDGVREMRRDCEEMSEMSGGDIQKKITRWTNGVSVLDELGLKPPDQQQQHTSNNDGGGLVVVASLLNKIPNIGG